MCAAKALSLGTPHLVCVCPAFPANSHSAGGSAVMLCKTDERKERSLAANLGLP